jgi:S1-C subfamily serine protease
MRELGLEQGDILKTVNGQEFDMESAQNILMGSLSWTPDTPLEFGVERDGEDLNLTGRVGVPKVEKFGIQPLEDQTPEQLSLREAWLKG